MSKRLSKKQRELMKETRQNTSIFTVDDLKELRKVRKGIGRKKPFQLVVPPIDPKMNPKHYKEARRKQQPGRQEVSRAIYIPWIVKNRKKFLSKKPYRQKLNEKLLARGYEAMQKGSYL